MALSRLPAPHAPALPVSMCTADTAFVATGWVYLVKPHEIAIFIC